MKNRTEMKNRPEMERAPIDLSADLLRSIAGHMGEVQHFDASPLPDKDAVHSLLCDLKTLLFPGYFGQSGLSFESIELQLGFCVARVYEALRTQAFREVQHACRAANPACSNCETFARLAAQRTIEEIPVIRKALDEDVKAAAKNDPAASNFDEIIFSYPGLEAVAVYRLAHFLLRQGLVLIPRIMTEWAHSRTGIDIHPGAQIGRGFFIDHGTGVVIGETTLIGNDVTLYQGVTLGALNFPRDAQGRLIKGVKRHPTIEDGVVIYAGATILGGETVIGANSVIGGNVWLTESVPADSRVTLAKSDYCIVQRGARTASVAPHRK